MSDDLVSDGVAQRPGSASLDDPTFRAAVVDLLAALAFGEITAFERLAEDSRLAPTLEDKAALAAMAVNEFGHYAQLRDRLVELGVNPTESIGPFVGPISAFHTRTTPADWLEGLLKAYVGYGISTDFFREIAEFVDDKTRSIILDVAAESGHTEFAVERLRAAIAEDPKVAGRLALWGRRLMGEALSQAQQVIAERGNLTALLLAAGDRPGIDLVAMERMFARITEAHVKRMAVLELAS